MHTNRTALRIRAVQVIMALPLGALVVFGSIYFSIVDPPETMQAWDWLVALAAFALGVGNAIVAVLLPRGGAATRRVAVRLLLLQIGFSVVKLVGYGESASLTFMAIDAVALALLLGTARRSRAAPAAAASGP